MITTTTHTPPEGLPTGRRVYAALVLPFGEAADPAHEDAGRVFRWGDVRLPRREVPVDVGHDQKAIGIASSFHLTRDGIWAAIKLGTEGERLVQRGSTRLSAEILNNEIVAVSLVTGTPAFPSAGLYTPEGRRPTADFAASPGIYVADGSVSVGPSHRQEPTRASRPSMFVRNTSAELYGASPEAEAEGARARWRSHVEELAHADAVDEERRLIADVVPMRQWPEHLPGRRSWEAREAQAQAETVRADGELAAQAFAERMERLEAAAERERRPWWRRVLRMSEDNKRREFEIKVLPPDSTPERIEFEIQVLPPETEPVVSAAEEQHRYLESEARRRAGVHHMETCTGSYVPLPDLSSWPERYREAFSDELARLKAAARPPVG